MDGSSGVSSGLSNYRRALGHTTSTRQRRLLTAWGARRRVAPAPSRTTALLTRIALVGRLYAGRHRRSAASQGGWPSEVHDLETLQTRAGWNLFVLNRASPRRRRRRFDGHRG